MAQATAEEFFRTFGLHIKSIRIKKGLSLNQVAARSGAEKATLSRLEAGKANITLKTIYKISLALEVPARLLFQFKRPARP